jgi:hypothetical protein
MNRSTGLPYEPRKLNTVVGLDVHTTSPATVREFRADPPVEDAGVPGGFNDVTSVVYLDTRPNTFHASLTFQSTRSEKL